MSSPPAVLSAGVRQAAKLLLPHDHLGHGLWGSGIATHFGFDELASRSFSCLARIEFWAVVVGTDA